MAMHKQSDRCKYFNDIKINMPLDAPAAMFKDFPFTPSMDSVRKHFEQYGYDVEKYIV